MTKSGKVIGYQTFNPGFKLSASQFTTGLKQLFDNDFLEIPNRYCKVIEFDKPKMVEVRAFNLYPIYGTPITKIVNPKSKAQVTYYPKYFTAQMS